MSVLSDFLYAGDIGNAILILGEKERYRFRWYCCNFAMQAYGTKTSVVYINIAGISYLRLIKYYNT